MTFGEKLLKLRKENGLSQEELAVHISATRQAISRWENGSSLPETEKVVQLSRFFDVSIEYLLNDEYESDHNTPDTKDESDYDIPDTKDNGEHRSGTIWIICGVGLLVVGIIGILLHTAMVDIIGAMPNTTYVGDGVLVPIIKFLPIVGISLIVWGIYKSTKSDDQ